MNEEIKVPSFTFIPGQLYKLLMETIDLYNEYVDQHGSESDAAKGQAAGDAIDGLYAEQELIDYGEMSPHSASQIHFPPNWDETKKILAERFIERHGLPADTIVSLPELDQQMAFEYGIKHGNQAF
jgi:hypothetical protein